MSHDYQAENSKPAIQEDPGQLDSSQERRAVLRKLGRFAAVSGPAATLLLAATTKPNRAVAST